MAHCLKSINNEVPMKHSIYIEAVLIAFICLAGCKKEQAALN